VTLDGLRRFQIIWLGQFVSVLGSGISWFAVTVWAWQTTGSATQFGLLTFCSFGAGLLAGPLAGVLVDRLSRKVMLLLCDTALAGCALALLYLHSTSQLKVWHLLVVGVLEGVLETLHWLAYSALVGDLVSADRRSRVNGMVGLADPTSEVLAPVLGGVLLSVTTLSGVLAVDIATYLVAIPSLGLVRVPDHRDTGPAGETAGTRSLWTDTLVGFRYIRGNTALCGLVVVFFVTNLVGGVVYALNTPLVLLRSGDNAAVLGLVVSFAGAGGVAGALVSSIWRGPRRGGLFILAGITGACLLGPLLMAVSHVVALWLFATFVTAALPPLINAVNQAIWQGFVPTGLQGRVFGARRLITQAALPIGLLGAGPLADSALAGAIGKDSVLAPVLGTGTEGAMAMLVGAVALLGLVAGVLCMAFRPLRELATEQKVPAANG
jgi:MFS transporter, DHA3 family, macrolide efflux protein